METNAPLIRASDPAAFGPRNIILTGTNTWHHVPHFSGPPSIKAVRFGEAAWDVRGRRRVVRPDTLLLLGESEEYSFTIDTPRPSRTFCPVFRRGLIEQAAYAATAGHEALLERPDGSTGLTFRPRIEERSSRLGRVVENLASAFDRGAGHDELGWIFESLASLYATSVVEQRLAVGRLTSLRLSTRQEIARRLGMAREAVEDQLDMSWTLDAMARTACMAPHHFHRCFRQLYGETPRDWLARRRAERAMALAQTSTLSVTEICLAVGYTSLGSFSTAFTRRFGASPSHYSHNGRPRTNGDR